MSVQSSMQYTVGTALSRAQDQGHHVDVLVEGEWVDGRVVALDGQGVVLEGAGFAHCIVKLEKVAAVRVRAAAEESADGPDLTEDGAMPMPGPRRTSTAFVRIADADCA